MHACAHGSGYGAQAIIQAPLCEHRWKTGYEATGPILHVREPREGLELGNLVHGAFLLSTIHHRDREDLHVGHANFVGVDSLRRALFGITTCLVRMLRF